MAATPEEALAIFDTLAKKRREERFVGYWTATPKQLENLGGFTPDVKIFGILGGNRSGKTELGSFIAVAWALGKEFFRGEPAYDLVKHLPIPEKANNIWVVGLDFPTLRDVIWGEKFRRGRNNPPLIPDIAPFLKKKPNDSDFQIFFANGSVITGKSADSGREKFQGASVDLVWIDEECEADVFDESYQRTVDCGGKILLTLTPLTDIGSAVTKPWVYDLYQEVKRGERTDAKFVQLSVLDNPYVPEIEKEKLKQKWAGHPEEKARLYGDFVQRSGLVYPGWRKNVHVVKPFIISPSWTRVVSIDAANTGITAALWGAIEPRTNNLYLYKEYYEGGNNLVISDHAKNILVMNAGDPVDIWLLDPFWGKQRQGSDHKNGLVLYREAGLKNLRLAQVDETYGLNASMEYINATIDPTSRHPKLYVFEGLRHFQDEIEGYVWDFYAKGEMKGLSKDKPRKRHDHAMNAFQYLCCLKPKSRVRSVAPTPEEARELVRYNSY